MIDLGQYYKASYEECIDDLNAITNYLEENVMIDDFNDDVDTLEIKAIRLKDIADRLRQLENNDGL